MQTKRIQGRFLKEQIRIATFKHNWWCGKLSGYFDRGKPLKVFKEHALNIINKDFRVKNICSYWIPLCDLM